jgi:hypothetical protein
MVLRQGLSEEEVAEAAQAAAAEAAACSSLVQEGRAQQGGDAQTRYYNLAHRFPFLFFEVNAETSPLFAGV